MRTNRSVTLENILIIGSGTIGSGVLRMLKRNNIQAKMISIRSIDDAQFENLDIIQSADIILECVSENVMHKRLVHSICSDLNHECLIATSTSSLSISELQAYIRNPSRFIGIHFMNPPTLIPIVEIAAGVNTSKASVAIATGWLRSINREVYQVPDNPGFALNAILFPMLNRAAYFFESSNMAAHEIDKLMVGVCNHKLGPLATLDLIGIDISLDILNNLNMADPNMNLKPAPVLQKLFDLGHFGKKTNQGFYIY
jgi:3-hydroxybutyryl-CoA dehydrogenase